MELGRDGKKVLVALMDKRPGAGGYADQSAGRFSEGSGMTSRRRTK